MELPDDGFWQYGAGRWARRFVCWISAGFLVIAGLCLLLLLLLCDFDFQAHGIHIALFFISLITTGVCFVSAYLLMVEPRFGHLWGVVVSVVFLGLEYWLSSFPGTAHLIH